MKAITVKQPWAHLICSGSKDIENRTWKTNFRGRVLIHASTTTHRSWVQKIKAIPGAWDKISIKQKDYQYGAIIGSVEIIDCVQGHESIWAEIGVWNWVLANPVLFHEPVLNVKGKLSFWDFPNNADELEPGYCYSATHVPSGEQWYIIGIDKKGNRVCAAGYPPSIGELSDCICFEKMKKIDGDELEYRMKKFGTNWI